MNHLSRRQLLKAGAASLIAAGVWPGSVAAQDNGGEDFTYICVNDLHYIDKGCEPFFAGMLAKMKQAAPDAKLMLVVGDLCENGTSAELGPMRDILRSSGVPTIKAVPGNHDWTTDTDRKIYEDLWPGSLNYTFEHGGWQFVGLDSSDGKKWEKTSIVKPTLDWVDQNLPRLDKKRPMILFTHFPLGESVRYGLANSEDLLNRFKEYNLRAAFNGHFHGYTERSRGDWLITTNRCCAFRRDNHDNTKEKGFFVCRTRDGKVTREFIEVAMPKSPSTRA